MMLRRRLLYSSYMLKLLFFTMGVFALCLYIMAFSHNRTWTEKTFIKRQYISLQPIERPGNSFSLWQANSKPEKSFLKPDESIPNRTSCEVVEFLASLDPSFRTFEHDTLCDDVANYTDILCRIYLRQIGVNPELEPESCYLKNFDLVPKIVFFVTFGEFKFEIWNYIAVVAAHRHVQPTALYIIGDQHPRGPWWELVIRDVPDLRFIYRQAPVMMSGKSISMKQQMSDIVRLQTLYFNGGIYLDVDMVVLKSVEDLLVHNVSLGMLNNATGMGNAFISTKRRNDFIRDWYQGYRNFKNDSWGYNSMKISMGLYLNDTRRVNLITDRLYRPQYWELPLLMNESVHFDWGQNYAMHIWTEHGKLPRTLQEIQTGNATVMQVFRYILYGDPQPRTNQTQDNILLQQTKL